MNQPPVAAEAWDAEGSTPPRPRPLEPPTGLTVGDIVRLDVKPSPPRTDLQVVSGTLELRHPGDSLVDLQDKFSGLDFDEPGGPRPQDQPTPGTVRHFRLKRDRSGGFMRFELDGPDGIYHARATVLARTLEGELVQRERSFNLYVER